LKKKQNRLNLQTVLHKIKDKNKKLLKDKTILSNNKSKAFKNDINLTKKFLKYKKKF